MFVGYEQYRENVMKFSNGHVLIDTLHDQAVFLVNLFSRTP